MPPSLRKLSPVDFTRVRIEDRFWAPRIEVNRTQTLPGGFQRCRETGHIDAFRLDWKPGQPRRPHVFWDSDLAKWIEAASYSLATCRDGELERLVDDLAILIAGAQQPDGYLNTYFTVVEPENRWTNLRDRHELYCAGHLIEAAVAHFQATGKRVLLDALCRYADYIGRVFGRGPGRKRGYGGHPEIELALVKLHRATGERRYLELARYFVDERGRRPHYYDQEAAARGPGDHFRFARDYSYMQAHRPLREQTEVTGHAVRGMYLYSAMADLAGELGDRSLLKACRRLWRHAATRMMYVTGGLGSSRHNEGFTFDYDLPNETGYCETCAAIAFVFWSHRLLQFDCDSRYADAMERALYNNVLAGVSLDGGKFFYQNPLASAGGHHRKGWFDCACCPPNVARLLASVGQYAYSQSERDAVVHLYVQGEAEVGVAGQTVKLAQRTDYPWDGRVVLTVCPERPARFRLKLRRPNWCGKAALTVNGRRFAAPLEKGYFVISRQWRIGDQVCLDLRLDVQRVHAHPSVRMDAGRMAIQRGPLVYCLEGVDNRPDLGALAVAPSARLTARWEPKLLGGAVAIHGPGTWLTADAQTPLYGHRRPRKQRGRFKAVPYCLWDNRKPSQMLVWLREG